MKSISDIAELDRIKTKDGRVGTIMLIMYAPDGNMGLCVEYDDMAPETENISIKDVVEII